MNIRTVICLSLISIGFALNTQADDVQQMMAAANKFFQAKDYESALTAYQEVVAKYPRSDVADDALLMVGINYDWLAKEKQQVDYLDKEKNAFEKLLANYSKSPRIADAYLYLGQVYSGDVGVIPKSVDYNKAIQLYEKAIITANQDNQDWIKAQATGRMGQCYDRMGKLKARAAYQEVIDKYPNTPWANEARKLLKQLASTFHPKTPRPGDPRTPNP